LENHCHWKKVVILQKTKYKKTMSLIFIKTVLGFTIFFSPIAAAKAQEASPWHEGDFAKARLIASHKSAPSETEGPFYLGFQIQLPEGWKTYWRTPGSAGLAPQFNWDGSENVVAVEVLFPSPDRFEIFNLHTYGYHDEVIYPLLVTPAKPGAAITIRVKVNYLVCKDLCVPISDSFELYFPVAEGKAPLSVHAALISQFLELVPGKIAGVGEVIRVLDYKILGTGGAQNIVIHLKGRGLLSGADLIVEDMADFKFGIPQKRLLANPSEAEFIIPVYALNEGQSLSGNVVVVTVEDGWGSFEEKTLEFDD